MVLGTLPITMASTLRLPNRKWNIGSASFPCDQRAYVVKHLIALVSFVGVFTVSWSVKSADDENPKTGLTSERASLVDSDALGKVVDVQGLAFVRPASASGGHQSAGR